MSKNSKRLRTTHWYKAAHLMFFAQVHKLRKSQVYPKELKFSVHVITLYNHIILKNIFPNQYD